MNIRLLRQKDFFLLMFGKLISLLGTEIQAFSLSLYVLNITGSGVKFGSVLAISIVPQILLGPIAGVFIDWFDKKNIIVSCDILSGIVVGIYAALFFVNGRLSVFSIYILVVILSFISALFQPAISTIIPFVIEEEELVEGNSLNSIVVNIGMLVGPILGGVLFGTFGLFIVLITNSISFILSGISEAFINIRKVRGKPKDISFISFKKDFSEGVKFIKKTRFVFITICIAVIINFAFTPIFNIVYTYIAKEVLKVTDFKVGVLKSIVMSAMIIGAMLCSYVSKKIKPNESMFFTIIIISIVMAALAVSQSSMYRRIFPSNNMAYINLAVIGFITLAVAAINNITIAITIQKEVPLEMLGRVNTVVMSFAMCAMPLGNIVFGFAIDKIEPWICILVSSIISLVTGLYFKKDLLTMEMTEDNEGSCIDA